LSIAALQKFGLNGGKWTFAAISMNGRFGSSPGGKVISRETFSALHKDMTAKR
jgi:hypothetical protein